MKNFAAKVSMLVIVSALAAASAACGDDDSGDEPNPETTPAATTAVTTAAAEPTEQPPVTTSPSDGAESFNDFDAQWQGSIDRLCTWAASAASGDLTEGDPFGGLVDPSVANPLRAGQLGATLGEHGTAFAAAAESRDLGELTAVGTDIAAACDSIGWTPS